MKHVWDWSALLWSSEECLLVLVTILEWKNRHSKQLCFEGKSEVELQLLEGSKKHTFSYPLKKHLFICVLALMLWNISTLDWVIYEGINQLACEPSTLLVASWGYNHFHGSRVSWHYGVNYLLLDTKWYQEKVIYLLQVTLPQRIKHSPRWENCFLLISMKDHSATVFSLPWSIRRLIFVILFFFFFFAFLHFQCIARKRTQWQNEECCFHWKWKATTQ